MSGCSAILAPTTEPDPRTRLKTPLGQPASSRILASSQAHAGVNSAGFMTTALPKASAGAIFQAGIAIGKFQGVISPIMPTASRSIITSTPGRTEATASPKLRKASPAKNLKICAARMVSPTASESVLPSSRASRRPSSSLRAMISAPAFSRTSWRICGLVSAQPGCATAAAATAWSTRPASPLANRPMISSVFEGFIFCE